MKSQSPLATHPAMTYLAGLHDALDDD